MGCEQSSINNKAALSPARVEKIIHIETQKMGGSLMGKQSQASNNNKRNSYQGVERAAHMDPLELQDALEEYRECEENIRHLEKEDPLTLYYIKKAHLQSINEASELIADEIQSLRKAFQNEDNEGEEDIINLRQVVLDYDTKDIISKAEQEYLTSVNKLEIAKTELEMLQQEKALVESEVSSFKTICSKLIALYNRQDEIAKKLTVGATNPDEAKLYSALAEVETRKIKISEAYQRWREARSQVLDACRQFSLGLKKWREIKDDKPGKLYDVTEEVRDDLVTSLQCITNARFYIRTELPYCSKSEMAILEKALSYIFIDCNTIERRLHADSCYKAFHNRCVALFQWIDMTIKKVIEPESAKVINELVTATKQVKEVRFRTIQKQFPDVTWKVSDDDAALINNFDVDPPTLSDPESIEALEKMDTNQLVELPTLDEIYGKSTAGKNYKSLFLDSVTPETQSLVGNGEKMTSNGTVHHK